MKFDVKKYADRFDHLAMQAGFKRERIAEVDGLAIPAYSRKSQTSEEKPLVYLSSGVHGDEPAGPIAILELLKTGFFDDRVDWLICPILNPIGLTHGTRENGQGIDLNRDYLARKSVEVKAHAEWLGRQRVPNMVVSLHEDWESSGFYLYEINVAGKPSAARDILKTAAQEISPEPEDVIDDHDVREAGWIDHSPRADLPNHWPEAIFLAERGAGVSYTLETPSSLGLMQRVRCHQLAVRQAIIEFLLTGQSE